MKFSEFFEIINRRKWILIGATLLVFMFSFLSFNFKKDLYTSSCKVLVQQEEPLYWYVDRGRLPLMDVDYSGYLMIRTIDTQVEVMKSRPLIEQAFIEANISRSDIVSYNISPIKQSDVITIEVKALNPYSAMKFANKIGEVYIKKSQELMLESIQKSLVYVEEQLNKQKAKLENDENNLREFKEKTGIVELSGESQRKLTLLTSYETEREKAKLELESVSKQLDEYKKKLSTEEQTIIDGITIAENPILMDLKSKLSNLQVKYSSLITKYEKKHPEVISLESEIKEIQEQMSKESAQVIERKMEKINPARTALLTSIVNLEIAKISLQSKIEGLVPLISSIQNEISKLPKEEINFISLSREKQLSESLYLLLEEKYQDLKISKSLKVIPARIIEHATLPRSPAGPDKKLKLFLSLILGLSIGIGIFFLIE